MNILDVILTGIALAMDAFAITIANCTTYKDTLTRKKEWAMPVLFALFQGLMPLLGYFAGTLFASYVDSFAGYLTAGIFFVLAVKIAYDNMKKEPENQVDKAKATLTFVMIILQALLTSIDAFAVGITFINLNFSVYIAVGIIAGVTFILIACALIFGKYLGKVFDKYAEWAGAVILFALAIKSLVEAII